MCFPEMEQENTKNFSVVKIISFEPGSTNSLILVQDTSHWQSICYQGTLRFHISLSDVYSKAGSIGVMKNIMKMFS